MPNNPAAAARQSMQRSSEAATPISYTRPHRPTHLIQLVPQRTTQTEKERERDWREGRRAAVGASVPRAGLCSPSRAVAVRARGWLGGGRGREDRAERGGRGGGGRGVQAGERGGARTDIGRQGRGGETAEQGGGGSTCDERQQGQDCEQPSRSCLVMIRRPRVSVGAPDGVGMV